MKNNKDSLVLGFILTPDSCLLTPLHLCMLTSPAYLKRGLNYVRLQTHTD